MLASRKTKITKNVDSDYLSLSLSLTLVGSSFYPSKQLSPLIGQHQVFAGVASAPLHRSVGPSRRGQSEQRAGPPCSARDLLLAASRGQRPSGQQ